MKANSNLTDYGAILDRKYGKPGTRKRARHEERASAFFASQILKEARQEEGITQQELAEKVGSTKSYISKIENGAVEPSIGLYTRLMEALGLQMDFVKASV